MLSGPESHLVCLIHSLDDVIQTPSQPSCSVAETNDEGAMHAMGGLGSC